MLERVQEHRKSIDESSTTETERMHKRCCENGCISGMTIAQEAFERGEKFQCEGAGFLLVMDKNRLVFVQVLYNANDWVGDPIVKSRKCL
jgi:hypothetical protein